MASQSVLKVHVFEAISKSWSSTLHQLTNRLYWGHTHYFSTTLPPNPVSYIIFPMFRSRYQFQRRRVQDCRTCVFITSTWTRETVRSDPIPCSDGRLSVLVVMILLFRTNHHYTRRCKYQLHVILLPRCCPLNNISPSMCSCEGDDSKKTPFMNK